MSASLSLNLHCVKLQNHLLTKRPKMKAFAKEMDGNDDAQQTVTSYAQQTVT
jgi:hypothetical protein